MKIWEQIKKSGTMAWAWFCGLVSSLCLAVMSALDLLGMPEVKEQVISFLKLNQPKWVAFYTLIVALGAGLARMRTINK